MGKGVMQTKESLTDVAKACVLRMVENKRGGDAEKERNSLLTCTLQYTSV